MLNNLPFLFKKPGIVLWVKTHTYQHRQKQLLMWFMKFSILQLLINLQFIPLRLAIILVGLIPGALSKSASLADTYLLRRQTQPNALWPNNHQYLRDLVCGFPVSTPTAFSEDYPYFYPWSRRHYHYTACPTQGTWKLGLSRWSLSTDTVGYTLIQ